MTASSGQPAGETASVEQGGARDAGAWAKPVSTLSLSQVPPGAASINVAGRRPMGALQGFGQMWQKTYRMRLSGVPATPQDVISTWRENFGAFWPAGNHFYAPLTRIDPGEVAVLDLSVGPGLRLSTGVRVIYADDVSFTFMNPAGHMFAGWITFSAYEDEGATVAQVQLLVRASDPFYELMLPLAGHRMEDRFWQQTLAAVAQRFGVAGQVHTQITCLDPARQWSQARNLWYNAAIRTTIYRVFTLVRWVRRRVRR